MLYFPVNMVCSAGLQPVSWGRPAVGMLSSECMILVEVLWYFKMAYSLFHEAALQ